MPANSKSIRLYLCSPYRDMHAERAYLHRSVFPQVAAEYAKQKIAFEVVDLNLGCQSEESAEGFVTLEKAFEEIDRCRPFFVGLLGEHYGCMLDEIPLAIGRKYPNVRHLARISRPHLEIVHGVLSNVAAAEHSFFYFRDAGFLQHVPAAEQTPYLPAVPVAEYKLKTLKRAIRASGRPVREYPCQWDANARAIASLEELGEMIAADLLDPRCEKPRPPKKLTPPPVPVQVEPEQVSCPPPADATEVWSIAAPEQLAQSQKKPSPPVARSAPNDDAIDLDSFDLASLTEEIPALRSDQKVAGIDVELESLTEEIPALPTPPPKKGKK